MRQLLLILILCLTGPAIAQEDTTPDKSLTFEGYRCTKDCSGHRAGYEWAERKGIETPEQCGGRSNSFTEGCKAWAEKQVQEETPADE